MGDAAGLPPPNKAGTYAGFGNRVLLREVRRELASGGSVCDLGCASGGLLAQLVDLAGTTTGVDLDPESVAAARDVADHALVGDVATMQAPPPGAPFDVVVCGDVLEHVPAPAVVLERVAQWLADDGVVVISVPNVAYIQARWRLLRGRWRYEDSGIFDDTHLRFFTRETILELVRDTGLRPDRVVPVIPALRNHVRLLDRIPRRLSRAIEAVWGRLGHRFPGLMSFQFVLVVRDPGTTGLATDEQIGVR